MWIAPQKRFRRHDHPRGAKAALCAEMLVKCALEAIGLALVSEALDGLDCTPLATDCERDAGWYRFTVKENRARAAFAAVTSGFYTCHPRNVAKIVDEQLIFRHGVLTPTSIQLQSKQSLSRLQALCGHGQARHFPQASRTAQRQKSDRRIFSGGAMTKIKRRSDKSLKKSCLPREVRDVHLT
jgi:hypothetical protein